jgi:asparagine synthase (glutamine-hydrolysing)
MGFAVPLERWFRGPLRQRVRDDLLNGVLAQTGYFEHSTLRELVVGHQEESREYSGPLWAALMFEAFLRKEQAGTPAVSTPVEQCA